jgi:hypothetical protein
MQEGEKGRSCSTNQTEEKVLENFDHKMGIGTDHFERGGGGGVLGERCWMYAQVEWMMHLT